MSCLVPCVITAIVMIIIFVSIAVFLYFKLLEESQKRTGNLMSQMQREQEAQRKTEETRRQADEIIAQVRRQAAANR
jgi:hypothetical protein